MGKFLDKVGLALFKSLLDAEKLFLPGTGTNSVVQKVSDLFNNTASGENAVALGKYNLANGRESFARGFGCKATGSDSYAGGGSCIALGDYSNTEGYSTEAKNSCEHAQGKYNRSNTGTRHSVGIGSTYDRKNAEEIMSDGRYYLYGVGGYDGTNPGDAKTVQEVLTEGVTNDEIDALFGDEDYYYY